MMFVQTMMTAGLCVILGAGGLIVVTGIRNARRADRNSRLVELHASGRFDFYMALVWGGMLLVQAGNILLHVGPDGKYNLTSLTLWATASEIFVFAVFLGRLLLRREIRWHKEKQREQAATRA